MKLEFFKRSEADRAVIIREAAARLGIQAAMVEKDFWVSWVLAILFSHPKFKQGLVFKGGTSLSKVFAVIERFSEDIDLSVSPSFLGLDEHSIEEAHSRHQRTAWMHELELACTDRVRDHFLPELERIAQDALGPKPKGLAWMEFKLDETTRSPVVLFHYPCMETSGFEYLGRSVKMEFGSLTDQKPVGTHGIVPWLGNQFPNLFRDFTCELIALEIERTFWEKATILHAEFHRDPSKPIRDRCSRHYSDMAALARHFTAENALSRQDLRQRVADWKSRFFAATWARYDLAASGTFRLVPPRARVAELKRDYQAMQDMFLNTPPSFDEIIAEVSDLENRINKSSLRS